MSKGSKYDLVINGGRVMDPETMYDDIANVGIENGRIVAITKAAISGKETIDASGHVVADGTGGVPAVSVAADERLPIRRPRAHAIVTSMSGSRA